MLSLGLAVFREGVLVHANEALLRLLGYPAPQVLGRPVGAFVAEPFAADVVERHHARRRGEAVPDAYETSLLTARGERRVELTVALNGPDTLVLVRDLNGRGHHRELLHRLAELGAALPSARTEEEVLRRVFAGLEALGFSFGWLVPEGERMCLKHAHMASEVAADTQAAAAFGHDGEVGARTPLMERVWREGAAYADDFALEVSRFVAPALADAKRSALRRAGPMAIISVRIDVEGAPRAALAMVAPWLREEDVPALRLFGAQVSAALEAAHTISRLSAQNTALEALNRLAFAATTAPEPRALFEPGAREIRELLRCDALGIIMWTEDQEALELVYSFGLSPEHAAYMARMPLDNSLSGEVVRAGALRITDAESCPPFTREGLRRMGFVTAVVVPLRVRSHTVGTLSVGFRHKRVLSALECETLQAMGSHFAAACESHRLLQEVRGRAEHLALIHEVGRSLVGTLELDRLLELGGAALARIVNAPDAYVLLLDAEGRRLVVRAAVGSHPELLGRSLSREPEQASLAARALATREIVQVEDARKHPGFNEEVRQLTGGVAFMVLPLVVHERPLGVAVLADPNHPRRFRPSEVERASAIANQLALALEGARLVEDLKKSYAELARAHEQLVQRERLAALGELSAVVAHEVRNPLGAIFNSVATLRRVVGPNSPTLPLLDIVGEESDRLNRIVDDLLNFARPSSPAPHPVHLERLLEEAVRGALADATGPLDVEWGLEPDVPPVPVDERMMRQAFLNLALNAVQAMTHGGVLHVGLRRAAGERPGVEVLFTDTGPGIPAEIRSRIFEPFFTTKAKGTGLGLALVKRIIESHYGKLAVECPTRGGTTFRVFLPGETESPPPQGG
ncbi:GAF domain-containing protein [Myxococcaceae bacterium GXIMD 01537]